MAGSFLRKVVKEKKLEIEKAKKRAPQESLLEAMLTLPPVRNFREALTRGGTRGVIAEYKRGLPNTRKWKPKLSLEKTVAAYQAGGARAVSLVTDEKHFDGRLDMIGHAKAVTSLPILRKDFVIDPYQAYQSRAARADALLLIAPLLPEKSLPAMVALVNSLGMTPVVEVHTAPDLKRGLRAGADVILINNRDLATLKVNMLTVSRLAKLVPRDILVIAASGYRLAADFERVTSDRVAGFLVGRTLLETRTPDQLLKEWLRSAG